MKDAKVKIEGLEVSCKPLKLLMIHVLNKEHQTEKVGGAKDTKKG